MSWNIPVEASKVLVQNKNNKISEKGMEHYRRGVGKFMHIILFSRLELVNMIRELSKL